MHGYDGGSVLVSKLYRIYICSRLIWYSLGNLSDAKYREYGFLYLLSSEVSWFYYKEKKSENEPDDVNLIRLLVVKNDGSFQKTRIYGYNEEDGVIFF